MQRITLFVLLALLCCSFVTGDERSNAQSTKAGLPSRSTGRGRHVIGTAGPHSHGYAALR
jgi:hypothetical protein